MFIDNGLSLRILCVFNRVFCFFFNTGRITTRPGQVGLCDGYILEGTELQSMLEKLQLNETK